MGNGEREQTLNQLLTELDGFDMGPPGKPVICLAAGAYTHPPSAQPEPSLTHNTPCRALDTP